MQGFRMTELTDDDMAAEETLEAILSGSRLPSVLRRIRLVNAPVTRAEQLQTVAICDNANRIMEAIYRQFGKLLGMIDDLGRPHGTDGVEQDFHTEVLDPLANRLLQGLDEGYPQHVGHIKSREKTQEWISLTNQLLARWAAQP